MAKLIAAPFDPDKSRYNLGATQDILNVIPVTDGWAPLPSASALTPTLHYLTDAAGTPLAGANGNFLVVLANGTTVTGELVLPGVAKGGIFIRTTSGSSRLFVGTASALYEYSFTDYFWRDVSGTSAPYSTANRWSFALYGDVLYCQNGADPEQKIDITIETTFSDNTTAPVASYIAVVADFLMRGRLVSNINSVQWSALNNPQANTIGEEFSDVQPFGDGNGVQGIIGISSGAVVFLKDSVEIMQYPDSAYVFRRSPVTSYRGAMSPYAICSIGQDDFVFYAADGFFRGLAMTPIGAERVDRTILSACTQGAREEMTACPDFRRKIIWFRVQAIDGSYIQFGYNWQLDRWCQSDADLTEMLALETVNVTIDGLGNLFPTLGDINIPFNSSLFDGGSIEFGGIDTNGYLVYLNGDPMAATITTNEMSLNGTNSSFVNGGRIDGDAANFTAEIMTAEYKGNTFATKPAVSPSLRTRFIPFRANGRVHKVRVNIPQGEPWTIYQGIDLDATGSGKS